MSKYIKIEGIIETPNDTNYEDLISLFLEWLENEHKSYFGGGYLQVYENGNPVE